MSGKGIYDIHCHIVPGVDDGATDIEETGKLLRMEYEQGVRTIIATPHFRFRMFETSAEKVKEQFKLVEKAAAEVASDLHVYLGCEFHTNMEMISMLRENKVMTITLHNQEHAIVLIQNIVKLIHAIDFFKISGVDYYILFLACYLHDISMVKIPAFDSFLLDTNEADQLAKELWDNFNEEFMHIDSSEKKISEMETKKDETKGDEEDYKSQEMEPDILSVKKYMLSSYKKLDGYFESSVRERHASDSAAEIRQRAEIRYLDTPMRELVAEVSEAHCADERNIYGTKSNASSQLMSIKFDKILLRLADLLDMSCYRVSKPILHHNVEQMSEESAFHWISHLLTQGYRLHTKYEIKLSEDNKESEIILAPKTIIEKLILEIYVDISQMSTFKCKNPCLKVKIDRDGISQQEITLICGKKCEYENNSNSERQCNFLCRWFCVKNDYLIKELAALKEYLNRNHNNYFDCEIEIKIRCNDKTNIDARQFEVLNNYIHKKTI